MRKRVSFPRWLFRQRLRRFLLSNWLVLVGFAAVCAIGVAPLSLVFSGFVLGFVHGAVAVFIVSAVGLLFLLYTGSTRQLSGAYGEDNTRDVLQRAKRHRHVWGWIDNVEVQHGDVDHLVLTPSGVLAIDSKWHAVRVDDTVLHTDAAAARVAARRAGLILRSLRQQDLPIQPLVVMWGQAQLDLQTRSSSSQILAKTAWLSWPPGGPP